ncbi:DUF6701 domain-containing protein [Marinobacter sp. LV10R510-11A]|uniref:DUF6701 domain-containing protein n=1 Tax=Marinobacter sp. LV10R510-11A TaxID=1415568 RepID=UPI0012FD760E|nr:DUF6701 domain-containing protein [Marinobacter sp. LV10R510-11A]
MTRQISAAMGFLCGLMVAMPALAEDAFFETGSVTVSDSIDQGNWETVTLSESYTSPVVIVGPVSHNNDNSLSARVRNVNATSFEVGFQSPCESAGGSTGGVACPSGGSWSNETIRYWVVEEGIWAFPDGTLLEAGRLTTSTVRSGVGSSNAADTVSFQQAFSSPPAVLHSVNSFNDSNWIASTSFASSNNTGARPGSADMSLALEGAEVTSTHGAEVIGWVAIEPASGTNNGNTYASGAPAGLDVGRHSNGCQSVTLGGFSSIPDAVASQSTMSGANGGWLRLCGAEVAPSGIEIHVDEDQVNDSERSGLEEAVSFFAFDANAVGLLTRPDSFCTGISAVFCDDFDVGTLASDGWTINSFGGGEAGISSQTSSSGDSSLFTSSGGVSVVSPVIDLSDVSTGSLDYWWRRGDDSFSENPDNDEDLFVQYLNDDGDWVQIEFQAGNGSEGEIGTTEFELPADALHADFQFRFSQLDGNGGDFDFWHIDDVVLRARSFICEPDDFERTALGDDWVTTTSNGAFSPTIVNGRLRMTEAAGNQATAATYQRIFPGADNFVQVEFDYFAYGGSGADGLAVVFSDASVTPQAGGYGGSLGYAQVPNGSGGFAGGWLGIGLDEYGNFSNNNEGRVGGTNGRTLDSVAVRGALPDYAYIADSGGLSPGIDSNNGNNPFRYRITIDSRNNITPVLTVERKGRGTGNSFDLLIQETLSGQPSIPDNLFLSLTGSTGGSTNIHELDNLQVCADKVGPVQPLVDHFELEHSGNSLTCRPEVVTIRACDNADCSEIFNDPVEVALSPSGWVGGNTFTMTGGTAPRTLRITSPSTVTLGVPSSNPGTKAFSRTLCSDGTPGGVSTTKCDLTFFDSGFDISIPDHVSDTEQTASIAAVRKDDITEECVPGFDNETKSVSLWSAYVNPSTGSEPLIADGSALPGSSGATRALAFDGNGVAEVQLRYADVGDVRLNARYDGSDEEAGLVMLGGSDFVARPDYFRLDIPGNPGASTVAAGNDFVAAGADFEINVAAINASGNVTPNFGQESPNEGVSLIAELVAPSGGDFPALTGSFGSSGEDCNGNASAGGTACGQFSWGEVGILKLTPMLTSGSYLSTDDVTGNAVDYVGRFVPDRFNVTVIEPGEVSPYCSVTDLFAYTGQALSWETALEPLLQIDAVNVQGDITRNYTLGNFLRLSSSDIGRTARNTDLVARNSVGDLFPVQTNLDPGALTVLDRGQLRYRFAASDSIAYQKTVETRVAPITPDYRIELTALEDADDVTSSQLPVALDPVFGFDIRFGRLQLTNAYGPETSDLMVPFQSQYFLSETDGFVPNTADSCWAYNTASSVTIDPSGLSGGSTSVAGASGTLDNGSPEPGSELVLMAPGESNRGDVPVTFTVPVWLQGDFDNDGAFENPSALATFGVYRGHDRVIYWREK